MDAGDVAYLRSDPGVAALAEVARFGFADATRIADIAAVRARFGDRTPVLVETTLLRRRAALKLAALGPGVAERWLFLDEALQQATSAPVAVHRARRLARMATVVHDATCSIGTEVAALRLVGLSVIGSDLDPVRLAIAQHNLAGSADQVLLCRADALHPITTGAVVMVDPARRSGGRRRFNPADYQPALGALLSVYRDRDLVVKVAPGIDFDYLAREGFHGEIEIASYQGSVREACLWSPSLTETGVRRRATLLDTGEQVTDAQPDDCPVRPAGRWIVDPDGAIVRAGLVRHYAHRHGLWQLDPDIAYLSGDSLALGMRGFEVLEEMAFDERKLRQALGAHDCGALEILVRGVSRVQADPDGLRRRLKLHGTRALVVVITRIGTGPKARARAFICRSSG